MAKSFREAKPAPRLVIKESLPARSKTPATWLFSQKSDKNNRICDYANRIYVKRIGQASLRGTLIGYNQNEKGLSQPIDLFSFLAPSALLAFLILKHIYIFCCIYSCKVYKNVYYIHRTVTKLIKK